MDSHSVRPGLAGSTARGRQWSRHFPVLLIVGGGLVAACSSSTKPDDSVDPGPPVNIQSTSVTSQSAAVGGNVGARPTVRVTDADGISVPGVEVIFAVTAGGGSLTSAVRTTDAQGLAQVGSWTLGPAEGANTVTATSTGLTGSPVTFNATGTAVVSNFNIKLTYVNGATVAQQAAFESAASRWQQVVTGELSNVPIATTDACPDLDAPDIAVNETVDDVLILVVFDSIDGPSNVLGSAGPCFLRGSNSLTIVGIMTFDTADIQARIDNGSFTDIVLHEMGHVLGIGSLWKRAEFNFVSSPCTTNPRYTAAEAVAAYKNTNGGGTATSIPLENFSTGPNCNNGTRDSHWRETVFGDELMTGFISGTTRPMSLTTVRSLADLGYTVDNSQADAFTVPNPNGALRSERPQGLMSDLRNDARKGPIYKVDDTPGAPFTLTRVE